VLDQFSIQLFDDPDVLVSVEDAALGGVNAVATGLVLSQSKWVVTPPPPLQARPHALHHRRRARMWLLLTALDLL
jgi:hypothetical protein